MKLLFCPACGDIFNLKFHLKSCQCGAVKGHYVDNLHAEVNGAGVSLAMGNGSFYMALANVSDNQPDFREGKNPWDHHATTIICWARAHEGPSNPHTKVIPSL